MKNRILTILSLLIIFSTNAYSDRKEVIRRLENSMDYNLYVYNKSDYSLELFICIKDKERACQEMGSISPGNKIKAKTYGPYHCGPLSWLMVKGQGKKIKGPPAACKSGQPVHWTIKNTNLKSSFISKKRNEYFRLNKILTIENNIGFKSRSEMLQFFDFVYGRLLYEAFQEQLPSDYKIKKDINLTDINGKTTNHSGYVLDKQNKPDNFSISLEEKEYDNNYEIKRGFPVNYKASVRLPNKKSLQRENGKFYIRKNTEFSLYIKEKTR